MIIIQNLILCINEKITLPRVGFEPVTVRCLKNDKDLAKMKLSLWHRATGPTDVKECLDMIKYHSKGCWSPTPLAVNKLGNLWQWIGLNNRRKKSFCHYVKICLFHNDFYPQILFDVKQFGLLIKGNGYFSNWWDTV